MIHRVRAGLTRWNPAPGSSLRRFAAGPRALKSVDLVDLKKRAGNMLTMAE